MLANTTIRNPRLSQDLDRKQWAGQGLIRLGPKPVENVESEPGAYLSQVKESGPVC